jgi:hypothetical protein
MEIDMKEIFRMIRDRELEFSYGILEIGMKGIGRMIKKMEKEFKHGMMVVNGMEIDTKEIG